MISPGILFALLTTLSWSIGIFPFTQAARRIGVNSLNHFRLLLATMIIGIVAAVTGLNSFIEIFSCNYVHAWFWLGISGFIGLTIGDYFAFVMYKILGARIGSVLNTIAPAATLLLGSILLNEHISVIGIAGIIITITGVNFVSLGKSERNKIPDHGHGSITVGIVAGILASLCQGAGLVLAKKGILTQPLQYPINPVHSTFIRLSSATFSLILFSFLRGKIIQVFSPAFKNKNDGLKFAIAGTIFGPVTGVCLSLYSVTLIDPSVAQTIFSLVPVSALLLSLLFFKERITVKSVFGLFLALAGVIILIWREQIQNLI